MVIGSKTFNYNDLKAAGRGLLGLAVGAIVVATVAISLGAPIGINLHRFLQSLVHLGQTGNVYLSIPGQLDLLILWFAFLLMVLFWERGLALGQCHLIGRGRGRNGPFVLPMEHWLAILQEC